MMRLVDGRVHDHLKHDARLILVPEHRPRDVAVTDVVPDRAEETKRRDRQMAWRPPREPTEPRCGRSTKRHSPRRARYSGEG
jgi:hypothetical protein